MPLIPTLLLLLLSQTGPNIIESPWANTVLICSPFSFGCDGIVLLQFLIREPLLAWISDRLPGFAPSEEQKWFSSVSSSFLLREIFNCTWHSYNTKTSKYRGKRFPIIILLNRLCNYYVSILSFLFQMQFITFGLCLPQDCTKSDLTTLLGGTSTPSASLKNVRPVPDVNYNFYFEPIGIALLWVNYAIFPRYFSSFRAKVKTSFSPYFLQFVKLTGRLNT